MEDAEDGMSLCTARPEFRALSENEVRAAVANDDCGENPITAEVTRLGVEFMARFRAYVDERGGSGPRALVVDARYPIEKFAIQTVIRYVESFRGGGAVIH